MGLNHRIKCPECGSIKFKVFKDENDEFKRVTRRVCADGCSNHNDILEITYK